MYNRGVGGKKGNSQGTTFRRMIRVYDPHAPCGAINAFTLLEGNGHNSHIFNLDLAVRDDGTFRKYHAMTVLTKTSSNSKLYLICF